MPGHAGDFPPVSPSSLRHTIKRGRLCVDQEGKQARNEFRARIRRALPQRQPGPPNPPTNYPPRIRTHGIQFHQSYLMVVGWQDLNLRLPSPETDDPSYFFDDRADIFARNHV